MKSPLNRRGLRFYLVLAALLRGDATHVTIAGGTLLIVIGAALHLWAKGCLYQNRVVAKTGPYRFVRHPFYLANALIDAGIAVMSGWWVLQVVLPVWWIGIYLPVMRREEDYLAGVFGSVYEEYRKRIPRLIPWRRPLPPAAEGFRWSNPNIAVEGELPRVLRLLAYPLLFFVCTNLRADGLSFFADRLNLVSLATLVAWYGLAWASKRVLGLNRCDRPIRSTAFFGESFQLARSPAEGEHP
jgi:hypothetical protein